MNIVHIEDDDDHAALVSAALTDSRLKSRVIRFENAESGLEYLLKPVRTQAGAQCPLPDLIILDLTLPGMDGMEFLEHLRSNRQTAGIPVVVLTNTEDPDKIAEVYRKGANSYVVKSLSHDDFVIKLVEMNMYWSNTAATPGREANVY